MFVTRSILKLHLAMKKKLSLDSNLEQTTIKIEQIRDK